MATPSDHDAYVNPARMQHVMSQENFANLGAPDLAYVRPVQTPTGTGWAIFAANGTPLGSAPERDLAFAAAVQNDLIPVHVH
jgi:hypothetical protein